MAIPTKAQIRYNNTTNGEEVLLRFHSVIFEEHEASTEITKFPAQSGFTVSNNAILNNRIISVKGLITNNLIAGAETAYEYGADNQKVAFQALEQLVQKKVVCTVNTNLGDYSPVIFNRFKTKQMAGMTDCMEFTITGEEVQIGTTTTGSSPTPALFEIVTPAVDIELRALMEEAGLDLDLDTVISQAEVDLEKGFSYDTTNAAGKPIRITYEKTGYDNSSDQFQYRQHTTDLDMNAPVSSVFNFFSTDEGTAGLSKGAFSMSNCLTASALGIGDDIANEFLTTASGELKKSAYGALNKLTGVNGNQSLGQRLLGAALDCVVMGATAAGTEGDTPQTGSEVEAGGDDGLPPPNAATKAAAALGKRKAAGAPTRAFLTKITGLGR